MSPVQTMAPESIDPEGEESNDLRDGPDDSSHCDDLNPYAKADEVPPVSPAELLTSQAVHRYVIEGVRRSQFAITTARSYSSILSGFVLIIGNPVFGRLTRRHVMLWWGSLRCAPSTSRHRLSVVHTFLDWGVQRGELRTNPAGGIKPPKQPRYTPRAVQNDDVAKLLAFPQSTTRTRVVVILMCQLGLRCAEVSNLQVGDIDWQRGTMLVHGKGGNERVLPITAEAKAALEDYLREHPACAGPLVRSYADPTRALTPGYIGDRIRKLMFLTGVKALPRDGRSAHALRHTCATDMLDAGANVRQVQAALGHQSLQTTQRYLSWNTDDLRRAMEGRKYRK